MLCTRIFIEPAPHVAQAAQTQELKPRNRNLYDSAALREVISRRGDFQ